MFGDLGFYVVPSTSKIIWEYTFWIIMDNLDERGILVFLGRSLFEILVHLGKSILGIFEILNNCGTSWQTNILESPSIYRLLRFGVWGPAFNDK